MKAKVPLILAYLDYQKKEAGLGPVFYPTGNLKEDMKHIRSFYKDKMAKYPEKVGKMIVESNYKDKMAKYPEKVGKVIVESK